jgi:hypothetical protein
MNFGSLGARWEIGRFTVDIRQRSIHTRKIGKKKSRCVRAPLWLEQVVRPTTPCSRSEKELDYA